MKTVDIATKTISEDQKIWLVHAGKGKKYYNIFKNQNMVFLDLPRLELTKESLNTVEQIRQHIRMSKAYKKYFHPNSEEPTAPSSSPRTYSDISGDDVMGDVGNVQGLFVNAQVGDLVIVTGYGPYDAILMGEIQTEFDPSDKINLEKVTYGDFQYRKVKWVSNRYAKKDLERELAERKLVNRKAVINIVRTALTENLYKYAYSSYILHSNVAINNGILAKLDIRGNKYQGNDPRVLSASIDLISYLQAAYVAINDDELESFSSTPFYQALSRWEDLTLLDNFTSNFNSKGKFSCYTKGAGLIAFLTIGIACLTSGVPIEAFTEGVALENSQSAVIDGSFEDACKMFEDLVSSLGSGTCEDLKSVLAEVDEKIDLNVDAKVTK